MYPPHIWRLICKSLNCMYKPVSPELKMSLSDTVTTIFKMPSKHVMPSAYQPFYACI